MIFSQLLYIFQSEHYDRNRFLQFAYSHLNWFNLQKRGKIDWTLRAKILIFLSLVLFIVDFYYFVYRDLHSDISMIFSLHYQNILDYAFIFFFVLNIILVFAFIPFHIIIADYLLSPLLSFQKKKILNNAKKLLQNIRKKNPQFISIGITGSYGKTTIKTILQSLLSEKYTVFLVPGNINTDLGIANYVLQNTTEIEQSDIILLEMGAFCIGEIKSICEFIQPDYSFLTAIGNQHLERFGSHENIKKAKFEIVEATTQKAFLNISDTTIKNYHEEFQKNKKDTLPKTLEIMLVNGDIKNNTTLQNIEYLPDFSGISFEYKYNSKYIQCKTKLIADHIVSSLYFCLHIAETLELSEENITTGIQKLDHVPHRLEVIHNKQTGVTVIDDSYNGNLNGFISGLKTLKRANGRKIVLTPGIVELGNDAKSTHEKLAKLYPQYIDVLLVILNTNTEYMLECIGNNHNMIIKTYKTAFEAHADLANILRKGDTIVFQNDLSDNY